MPAHAFARAFFYGLRFDNERVGMNALENECPEK
jgi:hypothetical protein